MKRNTTKSLPDLWIWTDKFLSTCNFSLHFSSRSEAPWFFTKYEPKFMMLQSLESSLVAEIHWPVNKSILTRFTSITSNSETISKGKTLILLWNLIVKNLIKFVLCVSSESTLSVESVHLNEFVTDKFPRSTISTSLCWELTGRIMTGDDALIFNRTLVGRSQSSLIFKQIIR